MGAIRLCHERFTAAASAPEAAIACLGMSLEMAAVMNERQGEIVDRAISEKIAYDQGDHNENWEKIQSRFAHVYRCPNSRRATAVFSKLLDASIHGANVLEVGCGTGWNAKGMLDRGAKRVDGIDISQEMLKEAQRIANDRLRFFEHDIHRPWPHRYDLIIGRAVLHHIDYQTVLANLYRDNLVPGGQMIFLEPLGDGLIMRLYWKFGSKYHTPEERPFYRRDIEWLERTFPNFRMHAFNYVSLPAALMTSIVVKSPDNLLLRLCDRIDAYIADHWTAVRTHFRTSIFHITKPADGS